MQAMLAVPQLKLRDSETPDVILDDRRAADDAE
jgi:hypothetical protein